MLILWDQPFILKHLSVLKDDRSVLKHSSGGTYSVIEGGKTNIRQAGCRA